jgi:hypothetical protein
MSAGGLSQARLARMHDVMAGYVKYRDRAGNESQVYSASTTAP